MPGKNGWVVLVLIGVGALVVTNKNTISQGVASMVWKIDPRGNKYDAAFTAAEQANGLPAGLLRRMAYQESRFNPAAKSPVGALGLMQFMPATARDFGINPLDPFASIKAAGLYMARLHRSTGTWGDALAAYNWGLGNVQKWKAGQRTMPAETVAYMTQAADVGVV